MVAEVVTATGWSWEYTQRHMDLHRYAAMQRLWRRSPPLQAMVQGYLGVDGEAVPPLGPPEPADDERALREFAEFFSAAGGFVH